DGDIPLRYIDTLFTAVSAVCVTGLTTVSTSEFSLFGPILILLMIQAGGLGIITFSTIYLALPGSRISLQNSNIIKEYFIMDTNITPKEIIRAILTVTIITELIGMALLYTAFIKEDVTNPLFTSIFHSVSAFCNAGFSLFPDSLESFRNNDLVTITIAILIIIGGIGFMVISDIRQLFNGDKRRLRLHSKLMLIASASLIVFGAVVYGIFEWNNAFSNMEAKDKILPIIFQSITTRTAGFNNIPQSDLSPVSKFFTLLLMFIGGGSGSTAGGIKVSTAFILFIILFKGVDNKGEIRLFNRRLISDNLTRAALFFVKAVFILFISIILMVYFESGKSFSQLDIIFECFSALGTVGLSTGLTPYLSIGGKLIIIATMFAGRVGLFALIMPMNVRTKDRFVEYQKCEVFIG
ncbi:MAG: TrkH family potassium uptake protein, partial [Spirochaetaceae bacterium]|nr:TrkH family potassium uptake protein [Spirochaetaceae bacterium]